MTRCPTCGHHNGYHADDCEGPPPRDHRHGWPDRVVTGCPLCYPESQREDDPDVGTDYQSHLNR